MMNFDTIVIGAGQAGPFLAAKLVDRGRNVALVEARDLGGTCVNRGCTPTKTLRKSARVAYLARRAAEFGVQVGPVKVDFAVAMQRMQDRVDQARSGLESWLGGLEGLRALARLLAEFLQAITDQPRAIAQVVLEIVFQILEMAVAQGAAKAPDTGFADPQFAGDVSGGLKGQLVQIGQHIAGNRPTRRCGG